jgi:hypothetical protein
MGYEFYPILFAMACKGLKFLSPFITLTTILDICFEQSLPYFQSTIQVVFSRVCLYGTDIFCLYFSFYLKHPFAEERSETCMQVDRQTWL